MKNVSIKNDYLCCLINENMTTVLINEKSEEGSRFLEYIKQNPQIAQVMNEIDNTPLPLPENELVTLEEFKTQMEELAYKRLGLKLVL
ncbi:MAG: hypothetical protein LBE36_11805 [Flavobacteriaceae bacterium]|jgi:hypothetical protein|nr:hypothetical protein [Flavobacteriaceae bacterium]